MRFCVAFQGRLPLPAVAHETDAGTGEGQGRVHLAPRRLPSTQPLLSRHAASRMSRRAMINAARVGAPKSVLEVPDIRALAARSA